MSKEPAKRERQSEITAGENRESQSEARRWLKKYNLEIYFSRCGYADYEMEENDENGVGGRNFPKKKKVLEFWEHSFGR